MATRKRSHGQIAGDLEAQRLSATLGRELRAARRARHLTQAELGDRVGISQSRVSAIERGFGGSMALEHWLRLGLAVGRPLAVQLTRTIDDAPVDAGHLEIQEQLLTRLRRLGWTTQVELPSRPDRPAHVIDVAARDQAGRYLLLEVYNRIADLGAAVRSTDRKAADLRALADEGDVRVCWVLRATASNRELTRRYPAVIRARFPASSLQWAKSLETGSDPPAGNGIVWWIDGRAVAMRLAPTVDGGDLWPGRCG